jgi:dimethylargininase
MFSNAIVRNPCPGITEGLSTSGMGKPDFLLAVTQHSNYVATLRNLGLNVRVLGRNDLYPDSTFIEDVALCTPSCAIITNPGAPSRRGEIEGMQEILGDYYSTVEAILSPGTVEAGDIMMAGKNYYIGISARTNPEGSKQLIKILKKYGMKGIPVPLKKMLHLKSGLSYLENNNLLISGEFIAGKEFERFNRITVPDNEVYAANSLWVNGTVIVPEGFPRTREKIEKAGYNTIALEVSEFRKVDGGLSCLSLRF